MLLGPSDVVFYVKLRVVEMIVELKTDGGGIILESDPDLGGSVTLHEVDDRYLENMHDEEMYGDLCFVKV